MKVFLCLSLFFCSQALAFETHASLSGSLGHDFSKDNSLAKAGFVLSAPIIRGLGWWSYTGVGSTVEDKMWASHSQGLDFTRNKITTGIQYTFSRDPDHLKDPAYPTSETFQVNVKVKLW